MKHVFNVHSASELAKTLGGVPWIEALAAQDGWPSPFVAEYPFGSFVFENGEYVVPCHGTHSPCDECGKLSDALDRHKLVFACGIDSSRGLEVFLPDPDPDQRPTPLRMLAVTEPFGLFELIDKLNGNQPGSAWKVSAGARTWFFLNAMGDAKIPRVFNKLYRPKNPYPPKNEDDDWYRVLAVARAISTWKVRVAFFPVPDNAKSEALVELYRVAWEQSAHLRDAASDTARLRRTLSKSSLKRLPPYLPSLAYLLGATRGHLPVMAPAARFGEFHGPTEDIVKVLGRLHPRHNFVHALVPIHLRPEDTSAGFYSFRHPPHPSLVRRDETPGNIQGDWHALWNSTSKESVADCFDVSWSLDFVQAGRSSGPTDPLRTVISNSEYSHECGQDAMGEALDEALKSPFFSACVVLSRK